MLVVDGGGSLRCALLGDNIAEMAVRNGWSVRPRAVALVGPEVSADPCDLRV